MRRRNFWMAVAGWLLFAAFLAGCSLLNDYLSGVARRKADAYRAAARPVDIPGRATGPGPLSPLRAAAPEQDPREVYEDDVIEEAMKKETKP